MEMQQLSAEREEKAADAQGANPESGKAAIGHRG